MTRSLAYIIGEEIKAEFLPRHVVPIAGALTLAVATAHGLDRAYASHVLNWKRSPSRAPLSRFEKVLVGAGQRVAQGSGRSALRRRVGFRSDRRS